MTSPYKLFKQKNIDAEIPAILDYGDFQIMIKHGGSSNKTFANAAQIQMKQFERRDKLKEQGALNKDAEKALEEHKVKVLIDLYADYIVTGWEGVNGEDDKPMKFSKENVVKLFNDVPLLFQDVIQQSMDISNFKEVEQEQDTKN